MLLRLQTEQEELGRFTKLRMFRVAFVLKEDGENLRGNGKRSMLLSLFWKLLNLVINDIFFQLLL